MKKFLAFLLAAMMLLSSAALAEYDTHLTLQVLINISRATGNGVASCLPVLTTPRTTITSG